MAGETTTGRRVRSPAGGTIQTSVAVVPSCSVTSEGFLKISDSRGAVSREDLGGTEARQNVRAPLTGRSRA
jgi:hypothetical protein